MSVILFTSNHPRHIYLANLLNKSGFLLGLVIEKREEFVPTPPEHLSEELKEIFNKHFENRALAEKEVFGDETLTFSNPLVVEAGEINSSKVWNYVVEKDPEIVITTGISVIKKESFSFLPQEIWNIHGGLSPWFKGAITHFWPSFLLKPQYTGTTIHYITEKIDAGNIIHQTGAVMQKGDGLHQLACRSLKKGYDSVIDLIKRKREKGFIKSVKQKGTGKLWVKSDWQPIHLELIYKFYDDSIVDLYLEGKIPQETPKLIENESL